MKKKNNRKTKLAYIKFKQANKQIDAAILATQQPICKKSVIVANIFNINSKVRE
jgi:hypothetical protein